ncbi:hypothetical protein Y1Q_0017946 [Alligator mississippiensis]|uniref:Uncharacterized protein n=1 Tax=Alligator mississippiensis TaxID=8496 RepID=A0A151MXR7_ALLMI|nr:hypothetical protein Y1Q_0017946 [Alligator mississippiensis]
MHHLHQKLDLPTPVEMAKEWKAQVQAWQEEDITLKPVEDTRDWVELALWAKILALEQECLQLFRQQITTQAQAVEATDDDCQTLDTHLSHMHAPLCPSPIHGPVGPVVLAGHPKTGPCMGLEQGPQVPPCLKSPWPAPSQSLPPPTWTQAPSSTWAWSQMYQEQHHKGHVGFAGPWTWAAGGGSYLSQGSPSCHHSETSPLPATVTMAPGPSGE